MYFIYLIVLFFAFLTLFLDFTRSSNRFFVLFWFGVFIALGTWGYFTDDYEPYEEVVATAYLNPFAYVSIEPLWVWLANCVHGDIDDFRFIAFSFIAILFILIAKSAKLNTKYFVVYYTLFCLQAHLCWIRQPLAMSVCVWGLLLLCKKRFLFGLVCVFSSLFIHKSAIIFVALLPFCIMPVNKKNVLLYLILIPFLSILFYAVLNSTSTYSSILYLQWYAEKEGEFDNRHIIFQFIALFSVLCQFLFLIYTIYRFYDNNDRYVVILIRYLLGIVFVSFFLFLLPLDTNVIYNRLLAFGMFIMTLIWSKTMQRSLIKRRYIWGLLLLLLFVSVREIGMVGNNYTRIERLIRLP